HSQWPSAFEWFQVTQHFLASAAGLIPFVIPRIVVMRRDEHKNVVCLSRSEESLKVLDRMVGFDALANHLPGRALGTEEVDLGIDDHEGRTVEIGLAALCRSLCIRGLQRQSDRDEKSRYCVLHYCSPPPAVARALAATRLLVDWKECTLLSIECRA